MELRILQLPDEVIAQIKSSITITSLAGAILGLVENSLDAQASKITVEVDFGRGGCIVEDDGLGIPPSELNATGGLGKPYHTSKYAASASTYGQYGQFLASLSALCLLSVTSHHHGHRSINSIVFHHSQVISRHMPALNSVHLASRDHGTKVSVRNLFGNMPVRVKQRSLLLEDRSQHERQWESLKQSLVTALIASGRPVSLRVKDAVTSRVLIVSELRSIPILTDKIATTRPFQSGRISAALSILVQAGLIVPSSVDSWIPASASSQTTVIKGAISLEPIPTKKIQFLSFGIHPLPRAAHNELYEHVNRLFSRSRFGVIEEEVLTEEERWRRQQDKRFKQDGLTKKQKTLEKGVDRWPMFILKIAFKDNKLHSSTEELVRVDSCVKAVIDVLDALITGWLSSHHFSPQRKKQEVGAEDFITDEDFDGIHILEAAGESRPTSSGKPASRASPLFKTHKLLKLQEDQNAERHEASLRRPYTGITTFNDLSRIKSAKRSFFYSKTGRPRTAPAKTPSESPGTSRCHAHTGSCGKDSPFLRDDPLLPGQLLSIRQPMVSIGHPVEPDHRDEMLPETQHDESNSNSISAYIDEEVEWTDPITNERHKVNARTGAAIVPETGRQAPMEENRIRNHFQRSVRLKRPTARGSKATSEASGWLDGVLQNWKNPVFRASEQSIPQVSLEMPMIGAGSAYPGQLGSLTSNQIDKSFREISKTNASRLTKAALKGARVVAQIEKKFILVIMATANRDDAGSATLARTMLVAIDQHAADERYQVEELLNDLCEGRDMNAPVVSSGLGLTTSVLATTIIPPLIFRIAQRESELFTVQAPRFANWGILFDIEPPNNDSKSGREQNLAIRTLPPVIAERSKLEPNTLISLLRSELWKTAEDGNIGRTVDEVNIFSHGDEHPWLRRIGGCPQGILDMVISRACRSAIMFNDPLTLQECENLVQRLSTCAFPFQCAHGRPSMVPLIDLGPVTDEYVQGSTALGVEHLCAVGSSNLAAKSSELSFVDAFSKWQEKSVNG